MAVAAAKRVETEVSFYRVPTDEPESDGTLAWDATTMVVVELVSAPTPGSATPTATRRPPR